MHRFRSMILRVSSEDTVLYSSQSLLGYLGMERDSVVGQPVANLAERAGGELGWRLARVRDFVQPNTLVTDSAGRVFEIKTSSERGVLDVVLDEVTDAASLEAILAPVCGTPFDELGEEELRTVRTPDLRFLTVCRTRLHFQGRLAGALPPMDQRILTNAFLEEAAEALLERGCTITPGANSAVCGLAGAPRYHADHAMRILAAAFDQMERVARLREAFFLEGKEMPPAACGIASGDALTGTFGGHRLMHYTAEGQCVEIAEMLSRIAGPGEILISKPTLDNLLNNLPTDWQSARYERSDDPDLDPYAEHAGVIRPLADAEARTVWHVGPELSGSTENPVLVFESLFEIGGSPGVEPFAVFRVNRAGEAAALPSGGDQILSSGFLHRLGKYRLSEVIGSGGMGRVWKAQDVYGNTVAIKTLKLPDDASTDAVKRFRREAEIMAGLPHRNICRIFEMSEHEGTHYIVMEFVDGLSLAEILHADSKSASRHSSDLPSLIAAARSAKGSSKNATEGTEDSEGNSEAADARTTLALPVEQALGIMEKVCEAVEFAHAHGVLHRDLKPGNILLRGDGEPLVADFGLAKQNGENAGASLSASGNVLGTVENMAPEQAQSSKTVDARADVYSLGTILYQMLTGHRHFQTSGNILSDIQTLQTHSAKSPRSLNPRIDQDLEVIILKCLRTDPDQRYRGVQALLADIRRYQNGEPISARPVTAVDLARRLMRRNKVATTVALASLAIIVTLTAASFWVLNNQLREARTARAQAEQARIEAEAMREKSEKSQRLAEEKQLLAEKKEQEALEEKARAEQQAEAARKAHQEKNAAELAALEERQMREKSSVQMEEERRKRVEADASLRDLKSEIERQSAERELLAQAPEPSPEELARRAAIQAAEQEFTRLESVLSNDFSRSWLAANAKTPDRVLDRIGEAIQNASQALLGDTASFRGWMLKGRLHMAAMEFPAAVDAFARAKILAPAAAAAPIIPGTMAPATSYELAERLENLARRSRAEFGLTVNPTAAALKRFPDTMDKNAGEIAGFFADRPSMKKNLVPPMNRNPTAPELALALMLKNNWSAPPVVTGGPMPKPMSITLGESGTNLSALDSQPVKIAILNGAGAAAFDSVMELKLESLEVCDAEIGIIAQKAPAAATLRSASFPNTKLTAPASLSNLRIVEALDLSNTGVTDLTPLARSLKLRRLNLGGLEPESLAPLRSLPLLIDLTISPETARDSSARKEIDRLSRLAYVRTPEDPPRQTVAEFKEKYLLE